MSGDLTGLCLYMLITVSCIIWITATYNRTLINLLKSKFVTLIKEVPPPPTQSDLYIANLLLLLLVKLDSKTTITANNLGNYGAWGGGGL